MHFFFLLIMLRHCGSMSINCLYLIWFPRLTEIGQKVLNFIHIILIFFFFFSCNFHLKLFPAFCKQILLSDDFRWTKNILRSTSEGENPCRHSTALYLSLTHHQWNYDSALCTCTLSFNHCLIWFIDWFIVFNITFSNISAISWRPVLVVEEAGENHRPWASNW